MSNLFKAISASTSNREDKEKKISFNVANEWERYSKKDSCCECTCSCKDDPKQATKVQVQQYYNGCRTVTWKFHGESYVIADNVVISFEVYLKKLFYFTSTNSTALPRCSNAMLDTMAKCNKLNKSALNLIIELRNVLPVVVIDFKKVADSLSPHLGHMTCFFTEALDEIGRVFFKVMADFVFSCRTTGCKSKVDYQPVFEKLQKLMNTAAFIAETSLKNQCDIKPEVQEAVTILIMQLWYFTVIVQGTYTCVMEVLKENKCDVVGTTTAISMSFNYVLVEVTQAINSVVNPIKKTITGFLAVFANITVALNTLVKDIVGLFGGLSINVSDVTQNILQNVQCTAIVKERTNIVKGFALN